MPLFDLFWAMLMLFLWVAWFSVVISVALDIFRSDDMGGGAKALWTLGVIILPWLGVLGYLIIRGEGMAMRAAERAAAQEQHARQYIREAAAQPSTADELAKLAGLRDSGVLTDAEFAAQKAKVLA